MIKFMNAVIFMVREGSIMASRRKLSWALLGILFLSLVAIKGVDVGKAPTMPNVFVDPPKTIDSSKGVGSTFTVRVNISNVVNLYGWQINMTFNPAVVNTTTASIVEGPFLKQAGATRSLAKKVNNTVGTVLIAYILSALPPPPVGASGNGTLVSITFKVKAVERATLLRLVTDGPFPTKLNTYVAGNMVPIEHTTEDGIFDNRVGNAAPIASFLAEPSAADVADTINFDASGSYDPDAWLVSYNWDYGDGETEVYMREPLRNINLTDKTTHSYTQAGIYTVTLIVTDNDGSPAKTTASVPIGHDVAIIEVKASHIAVMPGIPVTINVIVANEGYDYVESFKVTAYYNDTAIETQELTDMAPLTQTKLTFTWNTTSVSLGKYMIKAIAVVQEDYEPRNNELIDGVVTISLTNIVDYPVVVGGFTFHVVVESTSITSSLNFVRTDKKIGFNVTGKTGTGGFTNVTIPRNLLGGPYTVLFDSVPAVPAPQETTNETHAFLYFTYMHSSHTVEIYGATVATPPVAIFTTSTSRAVAGIPVTFNATDSYDSDGNIEYYHWNFGDGNLTTIDDPIITHSYASAGDYTIILTVEDNIGLTNSTQDAITVTAIHDVAITALTATPYSVKIGQQVTISITAINQGNFTETFNIAVYYDNTTIGSITVTNVAPEASDAEVILWNTTGVNPDTYNLKAIAATVTGETETNDNTLIIENAVSIQKLESELSISASPDTLTLGTTTTISGTIDPVRQSATITLHYKLVNEQTWNTIGTATTNAQGQYTLDWTPTEAGTYEIKASWQGDATTFPSESIPETITVHEPPTTTWLYIGVAVIMIAVAAFAFYFIRRKH